MFSGIIESQGKVHSRQPVGSGMRLVLESPYDDLKTGESIAVDGVCLTVVSPEQGGRFAADISPETLEKTHFQDLMLGKQVNLERAVTLSTRLSGHIVMGHVDGIATVSQRQELGGFLKLIVGEIDNEFLNWILPKGSIAVNGVSLTINETSGNQIELMLIPQTLELTNLKELKEGDKVNLEFDWLGKIVSKQIELWKERVENALRPH